MSNLSLISIIQTIDRDLCENNPINLDFESKIAFDKLLDIAGNFKPNKDNIVTYYISKLRESYDILYHEFEDSDLSEEEIKDYINYYTPHKREWFKISIINETIHNITYKRLVINNHEVIYTKSNNNEIDWPYDFKDLLDWLIAETLKVLQMVKDDTYNEYINTHLPNFMKIGEIPRKDYDELYPTSYNYIHKNLSEEEINSFCSLTYTINEDKKIYQITPSDYYDICAICYEALGIKNNMSSKELYKKNGKFYFSQDEFLTLNDNDYIGFKQLLERSEPWKHMYLHKDRYLALYPIFEDNYTSLCLKNCYSYKQIPDTVKICNAFNNAKVPLVIYEYKYIKEVLEQKDRVDIIHTFNPYSISLRAYGCNKDFMYFPKRNIKKLVKKTIWKPIDKLELI